MIKTPLEGLKVLEEGNEKGVKSSTKETTE